MNSSCLRFVKALILVDGAMPPKPSRHILAAILSTTKSSVSKTITLGACSVIVEKTSKIYIAGHRGTVGAEIARRLQSGSYTHSVTRTGRTPTSSISAPPSTSLPPKPDYIFLVVAKVGGIHANDTYCTEFLFKIYAIYLLRIAILTSRTPT